MLSTVAMLSMLICSSRHSNDKPWRLSACGLALIHPVADQHLSFMLFHDTLSPSRCCATTGGLASDTSFHLSVIKFTTGTSQKESHKRQRTNTQLLLAGSTVYREEETTERHAYRLLSGMWIKWHCRYPILAVQSYMWLRADTFSFLQTKLAYECQGADIELKLRCWDHQNNHWGLREHLEQQSCIQLCRAV